MSRGSRALAVCHEVSCNLDLLLKHTLTWADDAAQSVKIDFRPVHTYTMTNEIKYIPPKARTY